ncbi:gustatory receptor for sugar taste 64f-like [Epargyreus clarus]|uniref:gustatory receptor for sugar taste 64f-like n=1 Tax=Epargyreus clarus TaxID=520877 RepID=UPI003C2B7E66
MVKPIFVRPSPLGGSQRAVNGKLGGLHTSLRHILLFARAMGLLPLCGLKNPLSFDLRFTLRSPYTLYYLVSVFGLVLLFILNVFWIAENGISFTNITDALFHSSSLVSLVILGNLGRSWPKLIMKVEEIECKLPPFTRDLAFLCNVTMASIMVAALVEHFLSVFYGLIVARTCDVNNVIKAYFLHSMPWIFDYTSYDLWKGIMGEVFNIQSTFLWTYSDLLIMVISIYLTEHFTVHNQLLQNAWKEQRLHCCQFRKQHLNLVRLVKLINDHIGIYILTSFGTNLYWICTQLFYSLNKTGTGHYVSCQSKHRDQNLQGIEHTIYFTYSFSFLVVRTLLVLMLASRVHTSSNVALIMLYEVPADKTNLEIDRYIDQITRIRVALSGLDFFYVTRTMILTLVGTIVTYELVLLQFNK